MLIHEVLEGAADHIDRYGWHKGDYWPGGAALASEAAQLPACAMGACRIVVADESSSFCAALFALTSAVQHIPDWNDAPERTKDEVTSTLRAVAAVQKARLMPVVVRATVPA